MISYLVRRQELGEAAAKSFLESFRESIALVGDSGTPYISREEPANVVAIQRQIEQSKRLQINELPKHVPAEYFEIKSTLSGNTAVRVSITGDAPVEDDLTMIAQVLDLAKMQIRAKVERAMKDSADYSVS